MQKAQNEFEMNLTSCHFVTYIYMEKTKNMGKYNKIIKGIDFKIIYIKSQV